MNAVRFIEERTRMCRTYFGCSGCPACDSGSCKFSITLGCEAAKQVEIVKEWASAHPRKTRQDVFLEQWPNAALENGTDILRIKPCQIDSVACGINLGCCDDCRREFWGKVVE